MALAFIISLPLCLALLFLTRKKAWKAFWSVAILVLLRAIFLTGSRGGFLALLVVTAVCLWEFAIRGRRGYLLVLAVLVGVIFWHFYGGMLVGRFMGTFDVNNDTASAFDSGQTRQQLFWRSIEITKAASLIGVGPGNFDAVSGQWHTTHNSLTQVSSEGGVPALILYLLILWSALRNLNATKRLVREQPDLRVLARALFASLAGYLVGSLLLSVAYQFSTYILVAYTTALYLIAQKSPAQSRKQDPSQGAEWRKNCRSPYPSPKFLSIRCELFSAPNLLRPDALCVGRDKILLLLRRACDSRGEMRPGKVGDSIEAFSESSPRVGGRSCDL